MTNNILRINLIDDLEFCSILEFNVFQKSGYEVRQWIENKITRAHLDINQVIKDFSLKNKISEIEARLKINYASKSILSIMKLKKINQIN